MNVGRDTRKCPFCAEEIKAEAIKCKFCGEYLSASEQEPSRGRGLPPAVTWEYSDFVVELSRSEIGDFPKLGENVDIRTYAYSGVFQNVQSVDAGARLGLWLHLAPLLLNCQRDFAEDGWEPEPSRYGPDCLQLDRKSPPWGCLVMLITLPLEFIPILGNIIAGALTPNDYYVPVAVVFPMRRRVAKN